MAAASGRSDAPIVEGISSATAARNSMPACSRAVPALYSCTRCLRPPSRNAMPSMNSELVTMAPAIEALTRSNMPARSAVIAMTSSVRLPSVAFSSPPTASPVFAATLSVAWLSRAARGTIASTASTNNIVCDSGATCSAMKTAGTAASSHSSGLERKACRILSCFSLEIQARALLGAYMPTKTATMTAT